MNDRHPLEDLLNAPAFDILSAVQAGFRAIVDVRGKLAEFYLEKELARLKEAGLLDAYVWQDEDGKCDFRLIRGGKEIRLECKNIRSAQCYTKPVPGYKIELQKTRNSKDATPTRAYRIDEFEILAACLFNHTKHWEYRFIRATDLLPRPENPSLIKIMQCVPLILTGGWNASLADVLSSW